MSRNSCEVGTGAMSFHVVFIVAVVGGTVGGWVWCGVARHSGGRNASETRKVHLSIASWQEEGRVDPRTKGFCRAPETHFYSMQSSGIQYLPPVHPSDDPAMPMQRQYMLWQHSEMRQIGTIGQSG